MILNGHIPYDRALTQQEELYDEIITAKHSGTPNAHFLLFDEHEPVITLGKHAHRDNLLIPTERLSQMGISLYETTRGGDITYHGPGQWTVYPIFDLEELGIGVREYVNRLEEVAIRTLRDYDIQGARIPGAAGVWVHPDSTFPEKVCAIGIKCSHFVTMHGIAFNVNTNLTHFSLINPCGFSDRGATSLSRLLGHDIPMDEVRNRLTHHFATLFERPIYT